MEISNKRVVLIIVLCFIFSLRLHAQEEKKGQPLTEVFQRLESKYGIQFNYAEDSVSNIYIEMPDAELSLEQALNYLETVTDLEFTLNGNFVLVKQKDKLLFVKLEALPEIVISGYLVKGINTLNDGTLEVDFSDFDILPGLTDTDVLQAVQALPGIQSINETVSNINIRGGTHDQNLILWDNIKMYQSGHFFGLISMYNPQITQKVNLTKNGSDVLYTDGVSGTISMQTQHTINSEFKGSLGVNFIDANGFADIPLGEKSSLQIAARKSISDFVETPTYSNYFERISQNTEVDNNTSNSMNSDQQFDFYDVSLRWLYDISDKDQLRFNFINVNNELVFDETAIIDNEEESRQSSLSQNSIAAGVYYNRIWTSKLQTALEIFETDYKLKAINANIIDAQRFLQENVVSETSAKLKANYSLNDQWNLVNGYHFVETEITNLDDVDNPLFRLLVSEVVRTHALFSKIGYKSPNKKTNLNLGLRYNYIDKFNKQILEPRLSFGQTLFNHLRLEILGEMKHQNASQIINFQNDFLGIEKRRWQLSNDEDIPVIKSKQVSIGLHYNNKGWLLSADTYYKTVDGITTQSQGFQNQFEFVKTSGSYDAYGVDVLFRKTIDNFNAWLSYSYLNNEYTFKSLAAQAFPSNYDITHAISLGTTYSFNKLKLSAGLNWHTGKPTTRPMIGNEIVNDAINFESTNTSHLEAYLRVDVSALYQFKLGTKTSANLGVSIWNVLDKNNEINNFYRLNNGQVNETLQTSLGLTPNAVLRVHF